jgi:hypothetical protein
MLRGAQMNPPLDPPENCSILRAGSRVMPTAYGDAWKWRKGVTKNLRT